MLPKEASTRLPTVVLPAPLMLPPVQVKGPTTLKAPEPVMVPAENVKLAAYAGPVRFTVPVVLMMTL